jgi:hypothetical protein
MMNEVTRWNFRHRFLDEGSSLTAFRQQILEAQALAAGCRIAQAIRTLDPQTASQDLLEPEATDAGILLSKLVRRLQLFKERPLDVISSEFCAA